MKYLPIVTQWKAAFLHGEAAQYADGFLIALGVYLHQAYYTMPAPGKERRYVFCLRCSQLALILSGFATWYALFFG